MAGGVGVRHCPPYFSVLCLRICQAATVHVNVLMIQDILPPKDARLTGKQPSTEQIEVQVHTSSPEVASKK